MSNHGFTPYRPNPQTQQILNAVKNVCIQYKAWDSPLTVRQIFYRLVAEYGFPKKEKDYKALGNYIARSRRAYEHCRIDLMNQGYSATEARERTLEKPGLIAFGWIRDDKGVSVIETTFTDEENFLESVRDWADAMKLDRQQGQEQVIELWCEAGGMVPLMREIAEPYAVRVSSGGGYDSVTSKFNLYQRIKHRWITGSLPTRVLHIGDFDPSGEGMFETLQDDVAAMCYDIGIPSRFYTIDRVALRADQVLEMGVETAPPKPTDSRRRAFIEKHRDVAEQMGTDEITAQLEALTPPDLRKLVGDAIQDHFNMTAYNRVLREEEDIRDSLREKLEA